MDGLAGKGDISGTNLDHEGQLWTGTYLSIHIAVPRPAGSGANIRGRTFHRDLDGNGDRYDQGQVADTRPNMDTAIAF